MPIDTSHQSEQNQAYVTREFYGININLQMLVSK